MQIGPKTVVGIDYTLKGDDGEAIDTSQGREPLTYLHGAGNLVPGLERALEGKAAGESLEVTLTPDDGYGQRDEKMVRNLPLRKIADPKPQAGRRYRAMLDDGHQIVLVKSVQGDYASVDGNHPLAGMNLHFQVKVVEVRAATDEEVQHGHVHGSGGHHH